MKINQWPYLNVMDDMHFNSLHRRSPAIPVKLDYGRLAPVLGGRLAVLAAIMTFFASYICGIVYYGWWLGMAVGWLPSIALAWLVAVAIEQVCGAVFHGLIKRQDFATSHPSCKSHDF